MKFQNTPAKSHYSSMSLTKRVPAKLKMTLSLSDIKLFLLKYSIFQVNKFCRESILKESERKHFFPTSINFYGNIYLSLRKSTNKGFLFHFNLNLELI